MTGKTDSVKLMGILNATPDSSYDQGRHFSLERAVRHGIEMYRQGADMIDVGGESTRPGADAVPENEEIARIIPVIQILKNEIPIPISVDTMKPKVAEAALNAGAGFINDVSGFRDPEMRKLAADTRVRICVMHMHETPKTMQTNPVYPGGVIPFLLEWFQSRIELLVQDGVKEEAIMLDPGIGFGKTVADNIEIVNNLTKLKAAGFPLLVGLSRKSFLGKIVDKHTYAELLPATLAASVMAIRAQADILRVHDVAEHRDVINVLNALNPRYA